MPPRMCGGSIFLQQNNTFMLTCWSLDGCQTSVYPVFSQYLIALSAHVISSTWTVNFCFSKHNCYQFVHWLLNFELLRVSVTLDNSNMVNFCWIVCPWQSKFIFNLHTSVFVFCFIVSDILLKCMPSILSLF